ncbi:MAG: AraC family transcriptional regulator ligand-binding domain-containing protein [Myxococcota bacterium]
MRSAVAVPYLHALAEQLERSGVDATEWLAGRGLTRESLLNASFVMDASLFEHLVVDALALSDNPSLGLLVGEQLGVLSHGTLGTAAIHSGTVRDLIALVQRYMGLRIALLALDVDEGDDVRLTLRERLPLGPSRVFVAEAVLFSIKNVLDDASTGACEVKAILFGFPDPGYRTLAEGLLRAPVRYGAHQTGLVLPMRVMDLPLKMADPQAFQEAQELCRRQLLALEAADSWTARVQDVLLTHRVGFPTQEETARRLRLTARTLHRRLVDEGTSFRALLEEVRHRSALHQLAASSASVEEVGYLLGYTDTANFRRAFKRWTGESPNTFRNSLKSR